ncbi:MAG: C25 family cysteine peptidase [candidate division WOR-3 bacterium]|nr:C25 family cysteine peptidase [candidate division WOR-3 bacterium]
MKKILLLVILTGIIYAGSITKTFYFSLDALKITKLSGYDLVSYQGLNSYVEPGKPILPMAIYNVLVPADAEVTRIEVISYNEIPITGTYYLYPGPMPRPISLKTQDSRFVLDSKIYESELYPLEVVSYSSTGTKSGFRIGSFALFPLRYYPKARKLSLLSEITVKISYEQNKVAPEVLTSAQYETFARDVRMLVINPEDITRFSPPQAQKQNEIDCLIITYDGFISNFEPLKIWQNKRGFRTEILSTTTISNSYLGRDLQEKIRNAIIDYYRNYGLKWVILAGDNNYLPARRARAVVNTSPPTTGNIPCDLYYADLQWSWDGNQNNIFGEAGSDTVDFFADVYLGRFSVETATEISNILNKLNIYEKNPDTLYLKRILLPAAYLWDNYNHMLSQDSITNFLPSSWLYRKINLGQNDGLRYLVRDSINNGFGLAHLVGHGDDVGVYIYNSPQYHANDPQTQTNSNKLVIVNSIACYPGNFEYSDCLAERMHNAQNCAVAVMMNSRYGWGTPPVIGPSELLDISFYRRFFTDDSVILGPAFSTSKDAYRYLAETQQVWRWCVFELNLFGSPLMPIWKDTPRTVSLSYPDTIRTGPQTLTITVQSNGVPQANVLVAIYKPNEVYARARTNSSGIANIYINPQTTGTIYITASAGNILPKEESTQVFPGASIPYLTLRRVSINRLNLNQNNSFNVVITNTGNAAASNVLGVLRTTSSYITIVDSTSSYGTINPSDSSFGDSYTVFVLSQTPQGSVIPFNLLLNSAQGSWQISFNLIAGTPQQPGMIYAEHDTGYCLLGVTAQGSIGYTEPNAKIGQGFRYPKTQASVLYYASMLLGNSASYVVDRFYGQPASSVNSDWRVQESLRFVVPPLYGDEMLLGSYTDAGHTQARGIKAIQRSFMSSNPLYDDFVILEFIYENTSNTSITGLYSGIIADFDIVASQATSDIARSDITRRLVYMRQATTPNPTVGVKLLYPSSYANLTAIDHDRYVYPDSAMTESMKYRILNGQISLAQSNRTYDWSVAVSTGPFNLLPGERYRVAYAFVGGSSEANLFANADSAQAYYMRVAGISENDDPKDRPRTPLFWHSRIVRSSELEIFYEHLTSRKLQIHLYNIMGQYIAKLFSGELNNNLGQIKLKLPEISEGVYFIKIITDKKTYTEKLLFVR